MKVLVAVDGSEQSNLVARSLFAFSPIQSLILLHAIQVPTLAYPGTGMSIGQEFSKRAEDTMRAEGTRILDEMSSKIPPDIGGITKRIESGQPEEMILSSADEEKVDCIVVGSRGLGKIREQVFCASPCHSCGTYNWRPDGLKRGRY